MRIRRHPRWVGCLGLVAVLVYGSACQTSPQEKEDAKEISQDFVDSPPTPPNEIFSPTYESKTAENKKKLEKAVTRAIEQDSELADEDIVVDVSDPGIVWLQGSVDGPDEKQRAGEVVSQVAGVEQVENALTT